MAKICFFSWPIYSHVKNSNIIVEELVKKGNEVYYFGDEKFRYLTEEIGIKFIPYDISSKLNMFSLFNSKYKKLQKIRSITNKDVFLNLLNYNVSVKLSFIIYM